MTTKARTILGLVAFATFASLSIVACSSGCEPVINFDLSRVDSERAPDGLVNVTGFDAFDCTVTLTRGDRRVQLVAPRLRDPVPGEKPPAPPAGPRQGACALGEMTSCAPDVGPQPSVCWRSRWCLRVMYGVRADEAAGHAFEAYIGGTDYYATVECGGVELIRGAADAHRQDCGI